MVNTCFHTTLMLNLETKLLYSKALMTQLLELDLTKLLSESQLSLDRNKLKTRSLNTTKKIWKNLNRECLSCLYSVDLFSLVKPRLKLRSLKTKSKEKKNLSTELVK